MNLILIFLVGTLMGAFNFGFFMLGYYVRSRHKDEDAVEVNESNKEAIKEIMNWMQYGGK